jgi:hypothetical protein
MLRFEESLGIDGGHASGTCGGHRLTINMILNIARCKNTIGGGM